jgi:hypothetical protein
VSGSEEPIDELRANSDRLNEGLKTCRTVVENYRSLLTGQSVAGVDHVEHPNALNDNAE